MVTTLLAGASLGAIYAIVGIGYNIVFISSGVFNFAQAHFMLIGSFVSVAAAQYWHLPFVVTLVLAAASGIIVGAAEQFFAVRRLSRGGQGGHNELVTTLGVATVLTGIAVWLFGSDPYQIAALSNPPTVSVLGGRATVVDLALIVLAIVIAAGVGLLTRKTMIGLSSLAASEDRQAAMLRGINTGTLALGAFAVAGGLLALLGPIVAAKTYATYDLGDTFAVKAFVAVAIGGFGSYLGAVVGGFVVGVLEMFGARFLGSTWEDLVVFILLLIVLVVLPNGITGRKAGRTV